VYHQIPASMKVVKQCQHVLLLKDRTVGIMIFRTSKLFLVLN
jgi:hypothetical protein